jgi:hypothetical protein
MSIPVSRATCVLSARVALLIVATVGVLFLRRPDQFLHPTLWDEDNVILVGYAQRGWSSLFEPVNGYYILVSKLIAFTAFKLSFVSAPQIEFILILTFTCIAVLSVAFAPTVFHRPQLCAVAMLLVPTDSEVFGVSEYALWWAGILLLVAVFWRAQGGAQSFRYFFLIIGGLSSPIIPVCAGILALRAIIERRASEYYAAGVATVMALIQIFSIRGIQTNFVIPSPEAVVQKFVGFFFYAPSSAGFGVAVLAALIAFAWSCRARLDRYFFFLVLAYLGICAITVVRIPIEMIHSFVAGPRYFFYPFVLLSWIMIWLGSLSPLLPRACIGVALFAAIVIAAPHMSRRHDPIDWRSAVSACAQSEQYDLPVHYDGRASSMWRANLTGEQCRTLLANSVLPQ